MLTGCSHLTSVVTVSTGSQNVWIFQAAPQGPHPPRTPEESVPPGPESTQLFHSSLFGSSVLEPHLHQSTVKVSSVSADLRPQLKLQLPPAASVLHQITAFTPNFSSIELRANQFVALSMQKYSSEYIYFVRITAASSLLILIIVFTV